jgi:LPS export ABC transporter protein LptC
MEMTGVVLRQYDDGGTSWVLSAGRVDYERISGEAALDGAELRQGWRRLDGRHVGITLMAPRGRARLEEGSVSMSGGVTCTDSDGNVVTTAVLEYDRNTRVMTAPGPVRFEGRGFMLESAAMKAFMGEERYDFGGGVRGRFMPRGADGK